MACYLIIILAGVVQFIAQEMLPIQLWLVICTLAICLKIGNHTYITERRGAATFMLLKSLGGEVSGNEHN